MSHVPPDRSRDTLIATPDEQPLAMPAQDFRRPFRDPRSPRPSGSHWRHKHSARAWAARVFIFAATLATTLGISFLFVDWFDGNGMSLTEWALVAIVTVTFFWIAFAVGQTTLGLFAREKPRDDGPVDPLDVALLFPVYAEAPDTVFGTIRAMRARLREREASNGKGGSRHRFSIFVLSDTRDPAALAAERRAFDIIAADVGGVPVHYRHRAVNIGRKVGNIADWVTRWGGGYDAMVTMDADSALSAGALIELADRMSRDPRAGLIQTVPRLVFSHSLFGRMQAFANNVYGPLLARGLAVWSAAAGNYWGHNAIVRTRAFADCCGLPDLASGRFSGRALGGVIKSHDFVEAAMLVRAGWEVRVATDIEDSYEELPQTVVDYVLRDRRWAQGNLQHLRLLATRGLHPVSRFHMAQGAMAYIASCGWAVLLVLWLLQGAADRGYVISYFDPANPLFPVWPTEPGVSRWLVLGFVFAMLLGPKLAALAQHAWRDPSLRKFGGPATFVSSALVEIALSVVLAPVMMVQHVLAVVRTFVGIDTGWAPQNRNGAAHPWPVLLRFHALETVLGIALTAAIAFGYASWWLVPIAFSWTLAAPISWVLSQRAAIAPLTTPQEHEPAPILQEVERERRRMKLALAGGQPVDVSTVTDGVRVAR